MQDVTTQRDAVEVLASEFVARQRRGECPTVDEYVTRYPELADEIETLLPTIAALEKLKVSQQRTPDGRVSLAGCRLEQLGDFRIIREIGRGGMGIVYETEQLSLSRRVAVKVLPRQALVDPDQLHRFEREAKTAAGLHHTNIVPVFGVGQHEGFHYYVMQLIDGVGLDRVLTRLESTGKSAPSDGLVKIVRELLDEQNVSQLSRPNQALRDTDSVNLQVTVSDPSAEMIQGVLSIKTNIKTCATASSPSQCGASYWNSIAKIGIQIAEALHYAHQKGTLHRDIKPANIVVDAQGVCWVADFGLAKALEDSSVSQTGNLVGTLAYMAPEQFRGRADARSDIYSLGLTLYELLTQQPAYQASDRAQLLHKITSSEPMRPRQLQPAMPRDLETILLKTIAREPNQRYATAAELAADLQCFLEDRPIQARRANAAERLGRWCRRNPVVAALSATAALLLAMVVITTSIGLANTRTALAAERIQRARAESATEVAVQVLDRVYERFAPPDFVSSEGDARAKIHDKPAISEGAAVVLEDMLVFYDQLAGSGEVGTEYREKVALANRRIGDIRSHLGRFDQATIAYNQSLAIYRELDQSNLRPAHYVEIAGIYNELGIIAHRSRQSEQAGSYHQDAMTELNKARDVGLDSEPKFALQMTRTKRLLERVDEHGPPPDAPFWDEPHGGRPFGPPSGRRGPPPGPHPGPWSGPHDDPMPRHPHPEPPPGEGS